MTKHIETAILATILLICMCILSLLVYKLIPTECPHKNLDVSVIEATCETDGYTKNICLDCGVEFNTDEITASGHTYKETKVAPTCTEDGYTSHLCEKCGDEYKDSTVEALGHSLADVEAMDATCEEDGYTAHKKCENCTYTDGKESIPAGHKLVDVSSRSNSCTTDGYTAHKKCTNCDYVEGKTILPKKGHNLEDKPGKPATCGTSGYTAHKKCKDCIYTEGYETINPTNQHTLTFFPAKNPDCYEKGNIEHYLCSVCEHYYNDDQASERLYDIDIPITHKLIDVEAKPFTCTENGYSAHKACELCNYVEDKIVFFASHTMVTVEALDATCYDNGYTAHKACKYCYTKNEDYKEIPAGHLINTEIIHRIVPSTCSENGYTEYMCEREGCFYTHIDNFVNAFGHTYNNGETFYAEEDKAGFTLYTCTNKNCNHSYVEDVVPPTGDHKFVPETLVAPKFDEQGYVVYKCNKEGCDVTYHGDHMFYSTVFGGYTNDDSYAPVFGLDLANYAEEVDFQQLKDAGVKFVILKVGSSLGKDNKFEEYYAAAKAAGLGVGAYFFTYAENTEMAYEDATNAIKWLKNKQFEYPIYFDMEDAKKYYPTTFEKNLVVEIISTFMKEILNNGYYPAFYSSLSFVRDFCEGNEFLANHDIWIAHWAYSDNPPHSFEDYADFINEKIDNYKTLYSMWQYQGDVYQYLDDGNPETPAIIEGMCDFNLSLRDFERIIKQYGFNGFTIPEVEEDPETPTPEEPSPEPEPEPTPDPNPETPEGGENVGGGENVDGGENGGGTGEEPLPEGDSANN